MTTSFSVPSFTLPPGEEYSPFGVFPDHVKIDVARLFPASGHLVQVLPEYYQPANVWAVYVSKLSTSAKVRITVEFLRQYFAEHYPKFFTGACLINDSIIGFDIE